MPCAELYKNAKLAYDNNDVEKTTELFQQVVDQFPESHEAQYAKYLMQNY